MSFIERIPAISAVLLDLDGVLFDSEGLHHQALQLALGARGGSYTGADHRALRRVPGDQLARVLRIVLDLEVDSETLAAAREAHLARLVRATPRSAPGVPEVPRQLAEAGFHLGLMASSPPALVDPILDALGLNRKLFQVLIPTCEMARAHPAPDGHLMAARRLGLPPEACLAVESSRDGVLAAKEAGMFAAAIPCPATSDEEFGPADLILPRLDALPKALGLH